MKTTKDVTSEIANKLFPEDVIFQFGPPKIVISESYPCFKTNQLRNFMDAKANTCK